MKPRIPVKVFYLLVFIPVAGLSGCALLSPFRYSRIGMEPYDGAATVREIYVGADGFLLTSAGKEECLRLAEAELSLNGFNREFQGDADIPHDGPSMVLSIFLAERETGGILRRKKTETVEFLWKSAMTSKPILYLRLDAEDPSGFCSGVFLSRVISEGIIKSREWFGETRRASIPCKR